ncbi:MAG: hypothetical protein WAM88_05245 [Nitrososphaeraceae archaeon]|jgi:hypothetical protein
MKTGWKIERQDAEAKIRRLIENIYDYKTPKGELKTILEDRE